jgi:hypothetical protein
VTWAVAKTVKAGPEKDRLSRRCFREGTEELSEPFAEFESSDSRASGIPPKQQDSGSVSIFEAEGSWLIEKSDETGPAAEADESDWRLVAKVAVGELAKVLEERLGMAAALRLQQPDDTVEWRIDLDTAAALHTVILPGYLERPQAMLMVGKNLEDICQALRRGRRRRSQSAVLQMDQESQQREKPCQEFAVVCHEVPEDLPDAHCPERVAGHRRSDGPEKRQNRTPDPAVMSLDGCQEVAKRVTAPLSCRQQDLAMV